MGSVVRASSGLLLKEPFADLSGWTNAGGWTSTTTKTLVPFGPVVDLMAPTAITGPGSEYAGIREPQLYAEDGVWYLLYDSGDMISGWRQFMAVSTDRGLTWARQGPVIGLDNGSGGSYAAVATGWLEKRGSTYYLHRVTAAATYASPNTGLPADPYKWDTWSASSPLGPWTFVRKTDPVPATFAATTYLPGSVVLDSTTYYAFVQGYGTLPYRIGYSTATAPGGPWTLNTTPIWGTTFFASSRQAENPKVFFHTDLNKWVAMVNLIATDGNSTDRNAIVLSDSLTDWSGTSPYMTQRPTPGDGLHAIGVMTPMTGPDGEVVQESGYVPAVFDAQPVQFSPGWHIGRRTRAAVLEPTSGGATFSDATSTNKNLTRALTTSDFTAEFAVRFTTSTNTNIGLWYRQASSSSSADTYRLVVRANQGLLLQKTVSGSTTTVSAADALTWHTAATDGTWSRVRIEVSGSSHRAWLDGELQIDATDATRSTGTHVSLSGFNATGEVRLLSVRSSPTLTVGGLPEGKQVVARTWGGLPVAATLANASGTATITLDHGPIKGFEIDGTDYDQAGGVWPGDAYTASGFSADPRGIAPLLLGVRPA